MSNVRKVSVTSASEVIRDALRDWKQLRATEEMGVEELRRLWQEGIVSGPGRFKSIDQIKKEARRRAANA
jgi:antitoxin ParD1/3/4